MDTSSSDRHHVLARWSVFLFALAGILLVGSVVLPADESERVIGLLNDDKQLIEPLRLLASQLVSGVAEESAELQRYVVGADSLSLARHGAAMVHDDQNVAAMRALAGKLDHDVSSEADSIAHLLDHWRALTRMDARTHTSTTTFAASAGAREAVRDSIVVATASLESRLSAYSARKRSAVAAHERRGVIINSVLVIVALTALGVVSEVMRRERHRARRETALRRAAELLAGAYSIPDVARQVADGALELLQPTEVMVVHIHSERGELQVATFARAAASKLPPAEITIPSEASVVERAIHEARPLLVPAASISKTTAPDSRAIVIPLGTRDAPVGAVVAFEPEAIRFQREDLAWADIFGHLASFSYEKVRLLEEAQAGRRQLQRAMESRGRLIRGFSHDVKNPLGAADGYVALLNDGIYGAITEEQRRSIVRVRESLQRALSLIDDLHELARAETGRLNLQLERVDLGALIKACGDEYRAAAEAKHLEFVVEMNGEPPLVDTDPSRIRQVVSNLLSNAIKYTPSGRVALGVRSGERGSSDESCVVVAVQDTGPGIPGEVHDRIFDEFARFASGAHSGAGLGLAISKHVADALGCRLELQSEIGKGATFRLCIPVRSEDTSKPSPGGILAVEERARGESVSSEVDIPPRASGVSSSM